MRLLRVFDHLLQDFRYAARTLRKNPTFAVVAIATLGLGIGANTTIFSVVFGVLMRPLPYPDASSLVLIKTRDPLSGNVLPAGFSVPDLKDWQDRATAFSQFALSASNVFAVETP